MTEKNNASVTKPLESYAQSPALAEPAATSDVMSSESELLKHAKFLTEIVGQVCEDLGIEPDTDDLQTKLHEKVIQLQFPVEAAAPSKGMDAESLAQKFHEAYERLSPSFDWRTRRECAVPWAEVPEKNRKLMVAVCAEILAGAAPSSVPPRKWYIVQMSLSRCDKAFLSYEEAIKYRDDSPASLQIEPVCVFESRASSPSSAGTPEEK